jgi:hypothetical protein
MYVPFQGATFVPVSFDAGTYTQGSISLPRLDAIAAKDASGKLWLEVMNLDPENPVEIEADLVGVAIKSAAGETLTAPNVDSVNTVEGVKDETGLLMWDIMNEPFTSSYYERATGDEKKQREAEIMEFVRYNLTYVKKLDPVNAITVGYTFSRELEPTADLVDVLTFHDYTMTRSSVEEVYRIAEEVSKKFGKPMLNTETGCIARGNPYDMVLEIAQEHKTGWYLFNLMIQGYWGEIHGLFYPDGTIRDPAIIAAVMGFYRNRDLNTMIKPVPNREGHAERALKAIEAALKDNQSAFGASKTPTDKILDAAEAAANLLEAAEMVPMYVPPTAQIRFWRQQQPEKRDRDAIRAFAYDLGLTLKKYCLLY